MVRLLIVVFAGIAQVGCHAPTAGFNPFAIGQTRVPPPPTGVVGRDDYSQSPLPPANAGAGFMPAREERLGNYWQTSDGLTDSASRPTAQTTSGGSELPVQKNDQLSWTDPATRDALGRPPSYTDPSVVSYPTSDGYQPRLFPRSGAITPVSAAPQASGPVVSRPPRVRGFSHAGVQELRVPDELAEFNGGPVRQAAGSAQWQSRY